MTDARHHSRREVLAAGVVGAGAALVTGTAALTACTAPEPEEPDPLELPARRGAEDAVLAEAVVAAHPQLAPLASALAADRRAHAEALEAELRRVRPNRTAAPAADPGAQPSASATPAPAVGDRDSARQALVDAARAAQDEASRLVASLPGHRAALLASIAACCASHQAVLA